MQIFILKVADGREYTQPIRQSLPFSVLDFFPLLFPSTPFASFYPLGELIRISFYQQNRNFGTIFIFTCSNKRKGLLGGWEYNIFPSEMGCSLGIEHHGHFMVMLVNVVEDDPERDGQWDDSS